MAPSKKSHATLLETALDSGADRKIGGTGLGLVITSQLVALHGGRIDVETELGHGSKFTIRLPLSSAMLPCDPVDIDLAAGSQSDSDGITILCIDDEPDVLKLLQLTLEDTGYEVLLASDHDSAIAEACERKPDLICLDICMPDKDGYEVIKSLRSHPDLSQIPVIVASGKSDQSKAEEMGACCYLAKPVDPDRLVEEVRHVLAGKIESALIVEDDRDTSKLLRDSLTDHDIDVATAMNGREGLAQLSKSTPSVIILDLTMPVMDGFEFLEHIQADPVWRHIPVVILTARTLGANEIRKLGKLTKFILTKGRDDTVRVVEAALQSVVPKRRHHAEART